MKITFILPAVGKKFKSKYIKTWKMEPLTIATLKALTPEDIEVEFFDDRIELINYDTKTDLALITVETYTARRAYKIANEFKKRGVPVIMGGYHPTLVPNETAEFADAVIIGNAEKIWHQVIDDFKKNNLKKFYYGPPFFSDILPDRSIFSTKNYLPLSLIEVGRGCPFSCEFCAVSACYKKGYFLRPIRKIVEEIEKNNKKYFFFVNENIVANPSYAIKLSKEVTPLKIQWVSQATLTVAKNKELLKWLRKSGCVLLLIGIESVDGNNLYQMKKDWMMRLGNIDELIKRIHDEGINIYATFVFGFDYDTPETFKRAVDFSLKHQFFFAAFNHLVPWPGTPLYKRLKEENRIVIDKWWLDNNYKYGDIVFQPKNMTREELKERCLIARKEFFSYSSIIKRGINLFKRINNPLLLYIFLTQNFNLKKEVSEKFNLPLGEGLDELPK